MKPEDRSRILRAAFTTTPPIIGGLQTRPFTSGVFDLAQALELKVFSGSAGDRESLKTIDRNRELIAIFFLLSQPEDVVLDAVNSGREEFFRDWLPLFSLSVPIAALAELSNYIVEVATQTAAAATKNEPKPEELGAEPPPAEPPNSSSQAGSLP